MKILQKIIIFVAIIMPLASCAFGPVKGPDINTYALNKMPKKVITAAPTKTTILVSTPKASPAYQSNNIVYIDKRYQINTFGRNTWVATPAEMLTPLVVQTLRETRHFHAVVSPPFAGISDLRLDLHLLTLQQEFLSHPSRVRMALQADLVDNVTNKVIASKRFESIVPARNDDPYAGVIAANTATAKILSQIAEFTVQATMRKAKSKSA